MALPTTRVIPDGWSDHHRPTATATMTATCVITREGGDGTTGADGTWTPADPTPVYTGPCRVQALTTNERIEVAGETQDTVRRYLVAIEHDADRVQLGDDIEVTDAVDTLLVGMVLRVVDGRYGSEQWQRDMVAEEVTEGADSP